MHGGLPFPVMAMMEARLGRKNSSISYGCLAPNAGRKKGRPKAAVEEGARSEDF
jgi:hypothetical protein